jgi:hypothetical protein
MAGDINESTVPIELLIDAASSMNEPPPAYPIVSLIRFVSYKNKHIHLEYILFLTNSLTSITHL